MRIRDESGNDAARIREIHRAAFPEPVEADLVDRLRADGDAVISLVCEIDERIVGHAMFSRMVAPENALGLAPVAVEKAYRCRGVAAAMIEMGLRRADSQGWRLVFVLGDCAYYQRFGFTAKAARGFKSVYAGPHFMALGLNGTNPTDMTGQAHYAPAFSSIS